MLLYGSVARDDQNPSSDIDLVAIFDDLDYAERPRESARLERLASQASGHPVDVHVTDQAEWAIRTIKVPCSFENRIAAEAVVVYDRGGHSPIAWDKEIGLPATPAEELSSRYENMAAAVARLSRSLAVDPEEQRAAATGDVGDLRFYENRRFADACAQAHLVVECAAKALWVQASGAAPPKAHDIATLTGGLPAPVLEHWRMLTDGLDTEIHRWRQGGTYAEDRPIADFDETYLLRHARICVRLAGWISDAYAGADADAALLRRGRRDCARLAAALDEPVRVGTSAPPTSG